MKRERAKVNKQQAGFRFGVHRLTVEATLGETQFKWRTYRLVRVRTHDGLPYLSIRLYNAAGKFIKQLLLEQEVAAPLSSLLGKASAPGEIDPAVTDP